MRQTFVVLFSFLLFSAVRAFPFGAFLIQERHVVTESRQIEGRQLLDALSSIGNEISSAFSPPQTTSSRSVSAATRTSSSDDEDEDKETTSTRTTATRTSSSRETTSTPTRTSTRTTSSDSSTLETSTSSESSTSETSSTASSTTSVPAETAAATQTPEPSKKEGGGPNVAAIAGGIAGGIVFLIILNIILFWGCGPLKKWRENRAYQKMMDRSYRPALDDPKPFFPETRDNGLGLNPTNVAAVSAGGAAAGGYRGLGPTHPSSPAPAAMPQRAFSFSDDSHEQNIRRKPLPTIGTGGASPVIGGYTPSGRDRAEPWLPGPGR